MTSASVPATVAVNVVVVGPGHGGLRVGGPAPACTVPVDGGDLAGRAAAAARVARAAAVAAAAAAAAEVAGAAASEVPAEQPARTRTEAAAIAGEQVAWSRVGMG